MTKDKQSQPVRKVQSLDVEILEPRVAPCVNPKALAHMPLTALINLPASKDESLC